VPNLTWKQKDGSVVVNPLTNVPDNLNAPTVPAYRYTMRSVFKYWNLSNIVPYLRWLEYPMTTILTARGCNINCSILRGIQASLSPGLPAQKAGFSFAGKIN